MVGKGNLKVIMWLLFATALSLLTGKVINAQGFSRLYFDGRPVMVFNSIDTRQGHNYVSGVTLPVDSPYFTKAVFGKIDTAGNVNIMVGIYDSLPHSYTLWSNNLRQSSDGNFLTSGETVDSLNKIFIAKIDTNGSVVFYVSYTDSLLSIFQAQDVIEIPKHGYLIFINALFNNGNQELMVLRTDTNGIVLNKKNYGLGAIEFPWLARPTLSGNYMIGGVTRKVNTNTPFWAKTWLLEVDSMGNYVNQWIDIDNKNKWPYGMQQTADSGWIIVRQHLAYDVSNFQKYNAGIVKYDKDFTKEWEHYYGDSSNVTGFYDVEILPDGKYIVCGTTPIWGSDSAHRFGWIVKFDTDGTMLWERKYVALERNGTHSYLYDIDVLPTGELLACGELRFTINLGITPIQQGWILRMDSNGCVVENCLVGIDPQTPEGGLNSQIQVYPNPASGSVWVEVSSEMIGGEVKVYDVSGRVVKKFEVSSLKFVVDVNDWGKGVYVITVVKDEKFGRGKLVVE